MVCYSWPRGIGFFYSEMVRFSEDKLKLATIIKYIRVRLAKLVAFILRCDLKKAAISIGS